VHGGSPKDTGLPDNQVGGRRSEIGGRRSEVRGQRSEVGGRRSEIRGQRSEIRDQRSEIRDQRSEVRDQRSEASFLTLPMLDTRCVMLNGLTRKLGGHVGEVTLFASRRPWLAVIHGKRTKHFAFARHDRSGPASGDVYRGGKAAVFLPQRVCKNVGDDYRFAAKHSRPARTFGVPLSVTAILARAGVGCQV
jgi:hypothetical protein